MRMYDSGVVPRRRLVRKRSIFYPSLIKLYSAHSVCIKVGSPESLRSVVLVFNSRLLLRVLKRSVYLFRALVKLGALVF